MRPKSYSELRRIPAFNDRYEYLRLDGVVGDTTFGFDRWVNQLFYKSFEWRAVREQVILRDQGCDLGVLGYEISSDLLIHHINPISSRDIKERRQLILDPNNLITTTLGTHNAIHYGDASLLPQPMVERTRGDTRLW